MSKRFQLSRGLSDLLGQSNRNADQTFTWVPIERLCASAFQPRQHFDEAQLTELAQSIRAQGFVQPIVVRARAEEFEIIAGERRWRAAQLLQLPTVPVIIRSLTDEAARAMALVENLQRAELNALERAQAMQELLNCNPELTQQSLADLLGISRSSLANQLRLLQLEPAVSVWVREGRLDVGHAKCLLSLDAVNQQAAAEVICQKGLNVRQTERLIRNWSTRSPVLERSASPDALWSQTLSQSWKNPVKVKRRTNGSFEVLIHCRDAQEFRRFLSLTGFNPD